MELRQLRYFIKVVEHGGIVTLQRWAGKIE
jgi:hypothetical protein